MAGIDDAVPHLVSTAAAPGPRIGFESAVRHALERPPCLVSFSGGRDSSAVLATAAMVARRDGLPLPIPATLRFPSAAETDESAWQELVVRHLELDEWVLVEAGDEHGLLGEVARGVLMRHGLLWPANSHLHLPLLQAASGGSLMTGIDGDGLFAGWPWVRAPSKYRWPSAAYVGWRALALAPSSLRRLAYRRRGYVPPWVAPGAHGRYAHMRAAGGSIEPWRWDERVRWYWRQRYVWGLQRSMAVLGDEVDVRVVHPLLDRRFLQALATDGARDGLGDRTAIMRRLFRDLLPDELLSRSTQAYFDEVFWTDESRAILRELESVPYMDIVDVDRIRAEWQRPIPNFASSVLAQAAWLAASGQPSPR